MKQILSIKQIHKSLLEVYGDSVYYKFFNSTGPVNYIIVKYSNEFLSIKNISFVKKEKDGTFKCLFNVKVDSDPTFNCQLGILGGAEAIIDYVSNLDEVRIIFEFLHTNVVGKNMTLVDVDPGYGTRLADCGLNIHDRLSYTSTNHNNREFVLII